VQCKSEIDSLPKKDGKLKFTMVSTHMPGPIVFLSPYQVLSNARLFHFTTGHSRKGNSQVHR